MASEYLRDRGIDLQHEMDKAQETSRFHAVAHKGGGESRLKSIRNVRLPRRGQNERWNVCLKDEKVDSVQVSYLAGPEFAGSSNASVTPEIDATILDGESHLLLPSLCHPHVHLDKCFLLSHPSYDDLEIFKGDFAEALELTSKAKERFEDDDLMTRGEWVIQESIAAGVTHMRAFVEVDTTVQFKCLDAGLKLKSNFKDQCEIQICVFAQDPVFSPGKDFPEGKALIEEALSRDGVDAIGSTPYVEASSESMRNNITWAVETAVKSRKHLDLHLDYNLTSRDPSNPPQIYFVLERLHQEWKKNDKSKTIVLGHCTRLTLLDSEEWHEIKSRTEGLPVHFVGLPTSDLYMMGRPEPRQREGGGERPRGTLQIPQMIQEYGFKGAIGVNNVGNAFTPHGSCDPMSIASMGVGIYQAGAKADAQVLYDCISSGAKAAIGYPQPESPFDEGAPADFILFGKGKSNTRETVKGRQRRTVEEIIYSPPPDRQTIKGGYMQR